MLTSFAFCILKLSDLKLDIDSMKSYGNNNKQTINTKIRTNKQTNQAILTHFPQYIRFLKELLSIKNKVVIVY